ncbi:hypothetical protein LTR36_003998 [Oleoguttula mirabilis]|uniref:Uncharacterized protein n=1 Tax=Oleoguttula mirabilis TaxID=1507867 RepID=A0AAV9JHN1_9PEZI|nr:hypothetical protein LTR36_003998 [Oleoguttula mirabilis]
MSANTTPLPNPTFVDLGVTCTPLAGMEGYSECHGAYVTSIAASTAATATASTTLAKIAARATSTGLYSELTASSNAHSKYVLIGLILSVAVLGLLLGLLSYCVCVRRHRRKKAGGK